MREALTKGAIAGAFFACLSLVLNALSMGQAYERVGLTPMKAAMIYLFSGPLAGFLVGLLGRLIRNDFHAMLVGTAAFVPLVVAVRVARSGFGGWTVGQVVATVVIAALMGAVWGPTMWRARVQANANRSPPR